MPRDLVTRFRRFVTKSLDKSKQSGDVMKIAWIKLSALPSGNSSGLLGQDQMLDLQKRVDRILNSSKADNGSLENQLSEQLRLSSNSLAAAAPSNKSSPSSVVSTYRKKSNHFGN